MKNLLEDPKRARRWGWLIGLLFLLACLLGGVMLLEKSFLFPHAGERQAVIQQGKASHQRPRGQPALHDQCRFIQQAGLFAKRQNMFFPVA